MRDEDLALVETTEIDENEDVIPAQGEGLPEQDDEYNDDDYIEPEDSEDIRRDEEEPVGDSALDDDDYQAQEDEDIEEDEDLREVIEDDEEISEEEDVTPDEADDGSEDDEDEYSDDDGDTTEEEDNHDTQDDDPDSDDDVNQAEEDKQDSEDDSSEDDEDEDTYSEECARLCDNYFFSDKGFNDITLAQRSLDRLLVLEAHKDQTPDEVYRLSMESIADPLGTTFSMEEDKEGKGFFARIFSAIAAFFKAIYNKIAAMFKWVGEKLGIKSKTTLEKAKKSLDLLEKSKAAEEALGKALNSGGELAVKLGGKISDAAGKIKDSEITEAVAAGIAGAGITAVEWSNERFSDMKKFLNEVAGEIGVQIDNLTPNMWTDTVKKIKDYVVNRKQIKYQEFLTALEDYYKCHSELIESCVSITKCRLFIYSEESLRLFENEKKSLISLPIEQISGQEGISTKMGVYAEENYKKPVESIVSVINMGWEEEDPNRLTSSAGYGDTQSVGLNKSDAGKKLVNALNKALDFKSPIIAHNPGVLTVHKAGEVGAISQSITGKLEIHKLTFRGIAKNKTYVCYDLTGELSVGSNVGVGDMEALANQLRQIMSEAKEESEETQVNSGQENEQAKQMVFKRFQIPAIRDSSHDQANYTKLAAGIQPMVDRLGNLQQAIPSITESQNVLKILSEIIHKASEKLAKVDTYDNNKQTKNIIKTGQLYKAALNLINGFLTTVIRSYITFVSAFISDYNYYLSYLTKLAAHASECATSSMRYNSALKEYENKYLKMRGKARAVGLRSQIEDKLKADEGGIKQ